MRIRTTGILAVLAVSALAGCAVGPDYRRPEMAAPAAYKEAPGWKTAEPRDSAVRGEWWEIYRDPLLDGLARQALLSNQTLRAAEAQYRQALAVLGATRAAYFPALSGSLSSSRGQAGPENTAALNTSGRLALNASWEADVWGRIGRAVESNEASAAASSADLQAATLSIQATLVQTYLQLRIADAQRHLLDQTAKAYQRALQITQNRYEAGVAGRLDVAQAEAQLKSTLAQATDLGVQRAQLEHAIAQLTGQAPAEFNLTPNDALPTLPIIPAALPSALLERRPDIAAAERRAAAANAQIGVAQAAFFPAITLGVTAGYQGSSLANLVSLPNRFWSLGPALAASLFDGGARAMQKEQALAAFDKSAAVYRQAVLTGFQEVEDNLAALRILADEARQQQGAAQSAAQALALADNQYREGTVSYLNVVAAQATSLNADRSSLDIAGRRLLASVALLKALGGGWPPEAAK